MMKNLADFLTKNPMVVVGMFLFTLVTTIVSFILTWNDFYRDYLSKSVTVPVWLALLVICFIFFGWVVYGTRKKKQIDAPLILVADKEFGVEQVVTSGKKFLGCRFNGTEIIFDGQAQIGFESCGFTDQKFTFVGPAARTIAMLTGMYKDPSFQPIVDGIFMNIKSGELSKSVRPSNAK